MTDYTVYYGIENLYRLNTSISIALDSETTQLQPVQGGLRLIQLACLVNKTVVVIDCFQLDDEGWSDLNQFFNNGERFWVAHNAVFDVAWLQEQGIFIRGKIGCTMIASRLLTNGIPNLKHGLDALVQKHLDIEMSKEQQRSDWSADVLTEEQLRYAAKDVEVLPELDLLLERKLMSEQLNLAYTLECKAIPALAQMWRTGLPWNPETLEQCLTDYEFDAKEMSKEFIRDLDDALPEDKKLPREGDTRIKYLEDRLSEMGNSPTERTVWNRELEQLYEDREIAEFNLRAKDEGAVRLGTKKYKGFNINSPKQLVEKFTAVLGFEPLSPEGKPSASRQALRNYAADHEVVQKYLTWKKTEKRRQMINSIKEKMDADGFVRASYMQLGADTGRMSCIKPNNQQIPRDPSFRQCVEAPEGWVLVDADYGQMELRLAAALSEDKKMIEVFKNNEDLHEVTAEAIGCDRQIAKSANFGLLYGAGADGLRNYAGANGIKMSQEEAQKIRNDWLTTFSGIRTWQIANQDKARDTQHDEWPEIRIPVSNMRRFVKGDLNRVTIRCNTPIQGAGAAILKCALGNLWPLVQATGEDTVKIAAAVHDEILLLVKEGQENQWADTLRGKMEEAEAKWLGDIPALAETSIGKTWREVH